MVAMTQSQANLLNMAVGVFISCLSVSAQAADDSLQMRLGMSLAEYVLSVDILENLQNSECGYALRGVKYQFISVANEAALSLNPEERLEFLKELNSLKIREIRAHNKKMTTSHIQEASRKFGDKGTACGFIVSYFLSYKNEKKSAWDRVLQEYKFGDK